MTEAIATPDAAADPVAAIEAPAPAAPEAPKADDPRSQDDKIRDALNAVGALDEAPDAPLKKPSVADQERNEGGQFKAKEPKSEADKPAPKAEKAEPAPDAKVEPAPEATPDAKPAPKIAAPDRFNDGAKAEWEAAPEAVRHEVVRMQRELEKGITEYKTKAAEIEARDAPLKPFREMAEQYGVKFEDMLSKYVTAEQHIMRDPIQGILTLAQNYVPGGAQAFLAAVPSAEAQQMRQQIAELQQNLQQERQERQKERADYAAQQEAMRLHSKVQEWAADRPRFEELRDRMRGIINGGLIDTTLPEMDQLSQAYEMAERLIPAPAPEPAPPAAPAHTRPAATSISGAPASGSSPRASAPKTQEEAVNAALSRYGII